MPWPRPTTAQQKFEEEKKEALQGKGKRVPISYLKLVPRKESLMTSPRIAKTLDPQLQSLSPTRHILTTPLTTLPFHSFKAGATPSSITAENNSTPNTFSRRTDSHALYMCCATTPIAKSHHTIPFLDRTRKRIWGDVMGRQFWDCHRFAF